MIIFAVDRNKKFDLYNLHSNMNIIELLTFKLKHA